MGARINTPDGLRIGSRVTFSSACYGSEDVLRNAERRTLNVERKNDAT
jgi:hypothetical protein